MARQKRLTAAKVDTVKQPGQYSDGNGLTLFVEKSGSKHWVQRVTIRGRRRNLGLGGFPAVSLADARKLALDIQSIVKQGRDPLEEKHRAAEERRRPAIPTFARATEEVIALRAPSWTNDKHQAQWLSSLSCYAFPYVGSKSVADITSADILKVLTPIWLIKPETASRVRQRMETVLDWTMAQGWRSDNPASRSITKALPKSPKTKRHHRALHYSEVEHALAAIDGSAASTPTKLSLRFLVLTAARSGEVRWATWPEIDWKAKIWTIPATRMKARREHRVPLSDQALEVLCLAMRLDSQGGELIFPSGKRGSALSDMTFTSLLRRLDIPAVAHGFRSSFRVWVGEQVDGYGDAAEAALAHKVGNATKAAYLQSDFIDHRTKLMQEWADYICPGERQGTG